MNQHDATGIIEALGSDPSTIWRWRRTGILPPPAHIGGVAGWTEDVLKRLLEQREAGDAQ